MGAEETEHPQLAVTGSVAAGDPLWQERRSAARRACMEQFI